MPEGDAIISRLDRAAKRCFWLIATSLLLTLACVQVASVRLESQTTDEGAHLVSGYSYWKTRDYRLNPEHPPLSKLVAALPLLILNPPLTLDPAAWADADEFQIGKDFLYRNNVPADRLLFAGRAMTVAWSVLFGLVIVTWCRSKFGALAALFTLTLFAFDPTVVAHGRYVTSDLPVAFLMFAACISFLSALENPARSRLALSGLLLGLAIGCKFSALILYPAFALIAVVHNKMAKGRERTARAPGRYWLLSLLAVPFIVVWMLYDFDVRSVAGDPRLAERIVNRDASTLASRLEHVPVPAYYYFRGLHLLIRHEQHGHPSYLLGKIYPRGTWAYFPVAFLVKTPFALLLLVLLALALALRRLWIRESARLFLSLTGPLLVACLYLIVSIGSSINIGVRHILPVYPLLFAVLGGFILARSHGRWTMAARIGGLVLAAAVIVESLAVYPNYLAFFNAAAGGPKAGARYLLDSNLDWGQDLRKLKTWSDSHAHLPLCLAYAGNADTRYYGIPARELLPPAGNPSIPQGCYVAVSAHYLFAADDARFRSLRSETPIERIGGSIYIYSPESMRPR